MTFKKESGLKGLLEKTKIMREIRKGNYDMAFNFHGNSTSYFFTVFSGAKYKIGLKTHRFNKKYTQKITPQENIHSVLLQLGYLNVFNFDYKNEDNSLDFFIFDGVGKKVETKLKELNLLNQKFVLIHPNATLDSKRWPCEKFASLNDLLIKNGYKTLFIGANFEENLLKKIGKNSKMGIKYIIAEDINSLGAFIDKCEVFICCDSGPMHIAAALKKKIIVIWGSSNFNVWHPWKTEFKVVRKNMECSPCKGYNCLKYDYPKCIKDIKTNEVFLTFKELIEKK